MIKRLLDRSRVNNIKDIFPGPSFFASVLLRIYLNVMHCDPSEDERRTGEESEQGVEEVVPDETSEDRAGDGNQHAQVEGLAPTEFVS